MLISPSVSLWKIFASQTVSRVTLKMDISVLPTDRTRVLDVACVPTRDRAWSSSLPQNQPTHALGRLSRPRSPRVCLTRPGLAARMRLLFRVPVAFCSSFHRATCLATLATELPPSVRVQASAPVHCALLVDLLVPVCLAGSCLFGTVVPRIFLCRMRLTTVWILLASADRLPLLCSVVAWSPDGAMRPSHVHVEKMMLGCATALGLF